MRHWSDWLAALGTATVDEAIGRREYLSAGLGPIWPHAEIVGTAVTASAPPGDDLMVQVARVSG